MRNLVACCGTLSVILIAVALLSVLAFCATSFAGYSLLAEATPEHLDAIDADLGRELLYQPGVRYRGCHLTDGTLVIDVTLDRDDLGEFWEALAAIHRTVAKRNPPITWVTIEDMTGQRITVQMSDLRRYYSGHMAFEEFRQTWKISNP